MSSPPTAGGAPRVVVDTRSGLAPWRQIHHQLVALIDAGALPAGTRLPPIRQLARDLGVAAGTVAHAYRELEGAGRVATARARGTVVAAHRPGRPAPHRTTPDDTTLPGTTLPRTTPPGATPPSDPLMAAARTYALAALAAGADLEAALAAVDSSWPA